MATDSTDSGDAQDDASQPDVAGDRTAAVNSLDAMCDQLDETLRTQSAAGLALSLTVFKLISSAPEPWTFWFLVGSWVFFSAAVISVTLSLSASKQVFRWRIWRIDNPGASTVNPHNRRVRCCNDVAVFSFIAGIVGFLVFTIGNAHQMSGGT